MEKDQIPIHLLHVHPTPPHPTPPRSDKPPAPINAVGQLVAKHPMAFWSGLWMSVALVALVALGGLLSPGSSEQRGVSTVAVGSESATFNEPQAKNQGQVPLWLFGAIAISCTAGSVLVSRQLAEPHRRQPRPNSSRPNRPPSRPRSPAALPSPPIPSTHRLPSASSQRPTPTPPPSAASISFTVKPSPASYQAPAPRPVQSRPQASPTLATFAASPGAPKVTVVPAHESHPLDRDGRRLADEVDLRQHRSLSSWM